MAKKHSYTLEDFLKLKPVRKDFFWLEENGKVQIRVPKFRSKIGRKFCKMLGKDPEFVVNLDEKGTIVWKLCDGNHTVEEILKELERNFPKEEELDKRLFLYLYNLKKLGYIVY